MNFRRTLFILVIGFFCAMLWRVTPLDSKESAAVFIVAIVVLMMLPIDRFSKDGVKDLLKIWKNKGGSDGH